MEKNVLKNLSYGLYVIGAQDTKNVGCIVNTVFQITSSPLMIAVSINHDNYTNEIIKKTKKFSISILSEDTNPEIIGTFGYKSSKDIDKFANFKYEEKDNLPILLDTCGNLLCTVENMVETSTHTIFIAQIEDMFNFKQASPMTYMEEEPNENVWCCPICGYEVQMDELPEDYVCPICGAPIKMFKKK